MNLEVHHDTLGGIPHRSRSNGEPPGWQGTRAAGNASRAAKLRRAGAGQMVMTNRERVGRGLEQLARGLSPFV
jgi:hypothetical protein